MDTLLQQAQQLATAAKKLSLEIKRNKQVSPATSAMLELTQFF